MRGGSLGGREIEGGKRRDILVGPLRGGTALHDDLLLQRLRGIPNWLEGLR